MNDDAVRPGVVIREDEPELALGETLEITPIDAEHLRAIARAVTEHAQHRTFCALFRRVAFNK